jgi:HTH-type transcriptional regulator, transcriptional repressor of NAD biosynthesis genes
MEEGAALIRSADVTTRAFVLGKFMPPHEGHAFLCAFAAAQADQLTILVCSLPGDPIPGRLRHEWMRALFPSARVLWCEEIVPQEPKDDPGNFWSIWREAVRRYHPEPIDVVVASEEYGHWLAAEVGARFAPCDIARAHVPISGTQVRAEPLRHWRFIPEVVRPYFVKRVCLFGPECSGKTTLAEALAQRFETVVAPEFGRAYTEQYGLDLNADDLRRIALGQIAQSVASKRTANKLLIEDTDPVLTGVWSDMLLGAREPWFDTLTDYADLYFLCDVDFAWVDDGTRYFPEAAERRRFFDLCRRELERRGVAYVLLSGPPAQRLERACAEIQRRFDL